MKAVRQPAVAGSFYPGNADTLAGTVVRLLTQARAELGASPELPLPKGLIVPHAGYIYSGSTAALGYAHLDPLRATITRVLLLGPSHHVPVRGLALSGADAFATPLGQVPIDRAVEVRLAELPHVDTIPQAHAWEHSLEVQVPFLQEVLDSFTLVPLVVGDASPTEVAGVIEAAWGGPETLVLISSDLSHYLPYARAQAVDRETVRRILDLDGPLEDGRACGGRPVNGLLVVARQRGLRSHLLGMCNSGDTAGDRSRVVGYAAIAFTEADHDRS